MLKWLQVRALYIMEDNLPINHVFGILPLFAALVAALQDANSGVFLQQCGNLGACVCETLGRGRAC
jgi:hypothetical protein